MFKGSIHFLAKIPMAEILRYLSRLKLYVKRGEFGLGEYVRGAAET